MAESLDRARRKDSIEREPEQLIVEVGCGGFPYLQRMPDDLFKQIGNDASTRYVAVDLDEADLVKGKQSVERHSFRLDGEQYANIHFAVADGRRLPFQDNSASELILSNVLGDPEIFGLNKRNILEETFRVLKNGGTLKVIELYTPSVAQKTLARMPEIGFVLFSREELAAISDLEKGTDQKIDQEETERRRDIDPGHFISYYRKSAAR